MATLFPSSGHTGMQSAATFFPSRRWQELGIVSSMLLLLLWMMMLVRLLFFFFIFLASDGFYYGWNDNPSWDVHVCCWLALLLIKFVKILTTLRGL